MPTDDIANEIVANALNSLKEAGVPERNIHKEELVVKDNGNKPLSPTTGEPKGAVLGGDMEAQQQALVEPKEEKLESSQSESVTLTKAEIAELLEQASRKAQSIADKRISGLQTQLQNVTNLMASQIQAKEEAEFENLPKDEQLERRLARIEQGKVQHGGQVNQSQQAIQMIYQQLSDIVDATGLKVDDPRIDWSPDTAPSDVVNLYPQIRAKLLSSVKSAVQEDLKKAIDSVKASTEKEISKVKKRVGVDRVATSGASGLGTPNIDQMSPAEKIKYGFEQERLQAQIQK